MRRAQKKKDGPSPGELLDLWVGRSDVSPPAPTRGLPPSIVIGGSLLGVVLTLAMARFAIDVLLVLVGLVALGFVLHLLGSLIADSDMVSPGWVLALLVMAALGAWVLLPEHAVMELGRYVPKPLVQAVEWLEARGLAHRVLIGPGEGTPAPPPASPAPAGPGVAATSGSRPAEGASSTQPEDTGATPAPLVTVSVSAPSSRAGERVVFMARLPTGSSATSVRFYDGGDLLGESRVRAEGVWSIAYFPVTNLAAGSHEIHAEAMSALRTVAKSEAVRHVVR